MLKYPIGQKQIRFSKLTNQKPNLEHGVHFWALSFQSFIVSDPDQDVYPWFYISKSINTEAISMPLENINEWKPKNQIFNSIVILASCLQSDQDTFLCLHLINKSED